MTIVYLKAKLAGYHSAIIPGVRPLFTIQIYDQLADAILEGAVTILRHKN